MEDFNKLLNWKLKVGSHEFPGPDGGTCINEAALVVAGFPYKAIERVSDLPTCFSAPISAYALDLNDLMADGWRQELLMPFVVRLAATADNRQVETARAETICVAVVSKILPIMLRGLGMETWAFALEREDRWERRNELIKDVLQAYTVFGPKGEFSESVFEALYKAQVVCTSSVGLHVGRVRNVAKVVYDVSSYVFQSDLRLIPGMQRKVWELAVEALDAALAIGRQAAPVETALIKARVEAAKRAVPVG